MERCKGLVHRATGERGFVLDLRIKRHFLLSPGICKTKFFIININRGKKLRIIERTFLSYRRASQKVQYESAGISLLEEKSVPVTGDLNRV